MSLQLNVARRLAAVVIIASLFVALVPAAASALTANQIRDRLYAKIDRVRDNHDLRHLNRNAKTAYWARDHSAWMGRQSGLPITRLIHDRDTELWAEVPSDAQWRAENIAFANTGPGVATIIHRTLMASPGHRANILARRATHMGIGVVKRDGFVWVTQRFVDRRWE
jgi:uncharacterized protein YkwD